MADEHGYKRPEGIAPSLFRGLLVSPVPMSLRFFEESTQAGKPQINPSGKDSKIFRENFGKKIDFWINRDYIYSLFA